MTSSELELRKLQAEAAEWATRNFGEGRLELCALGVCEEAGELAHAVLKHAQGIRGMDDMAMRVAVADAAGDIVIYLAHLCDIAGIDLQWAITTTWAKVKRRDWVADAANGGQLRNPQTER